MALHRTRVGIRFARLLRRHGTSTERLVYSALRGRQFFDAKFRRQHSVGPYFLDLACVELLIAIELDGRHHAERTEEDEVRDAYLGAHGWVVLRFWNTEVWEDFERFLEKLALVIELRRDDLPRKTDFPSP
ncbi:MAG: endonuclease domain-containing protein [Archangium sp.]|nr:endonuclease domain-containing protein [Archangium sp.]